MSPGRAKIGLPGGGGGQVHVGGEVGGKGVGMKWERTLPPLQLLNLLHLSLRLLLLLLLLLPLPPIELPPPLLLPTIPTSGTIPSSSSTTATTARG